MNFSEGQEIYSRRLKEVLGLEKSPVAITFSKKPANKANTERYRVCGAIQAAASGSIINLSKENSSCRGGTTYLGLGPQRERVEEFLVYGEKLSCSLATARRAITYINKKAPPPLGLAEYVVFSPLEKAELEPDLVLFLCNPEQACRLITLARYREGVLPQNEFGGALCWSTITYPLITGNINVSLGDHVAREIEHWKPEELAVTVPAHKLHQIVESIDYSTAGVAEPSKEYEELLEE